MYITTRELLERAEFCDMRVEFWDENGFGDGDSPTEPFAEINIGDDMFDESIVNLELADFQISDGVLSVWVYRE